MKKWATFLILSLFLAGGCGPKVQVEWEKYSPELMQEIRHSGIPAIAYFYAAWCPPCYQLKEETYSKQSVVDTLEPLRKVKVDLSFKRSPKIQAIAAEYNVRGYPTITFFTPDGSEDLEFRFSGFMGPDQFVRHVQAFKSKHRIHSLQAT